MMAPPRGDPNSSDLAQACDAGRHHCRPVVIRQLFEIRQSAARSAKKVVNTDANRLARKPLHVVANRERPVLSAQYTEASALVTRFRSRAITDALMKYSP